MYVDATTMRQWASSAWERLELEPPVDLRKICEYLNIEIEQLSCHVCAAGIHVPVDVNLSVIGLNGYLPDGCRRWTLAHELGHALIERATGKRMDCQGSQSKWLERLCDYFAADLLMPETLVRKYAEDLGHPRYHDKTGTIAAHFGVSITAMRNRLRRLGLTPRRTTMSY